MTVVNVCGMPRLAGCFDYTPVINRKVQSAIHSLAFDTTQHCRYSRSSKTYCYNKKTIMLGVSSTLSSSSSITPPSGDDKDPQHSNNNNNNRSEPNDPKKDGSIMQPLVSTSVDHSSSSKKGSSNTSEMDNHHSMSRYMSDAAKQRRKDLFGDCALVEIIHLHDCLRGALQALEKDLMDLSHMVLKEEILDEKKNQSKKYVDASDTTTATATANTQDQFQYHAVLSQLESRATARFQVIWSVFRAHSAAEDEFIWPTLRLKTQGQIQGCNSPRHRPCGDSPHESVPCTNSSVGDEIPVSCCKDTKVNCNGGGKDGWKPKGDDSEDELIEQEEYEEDHADEERMFTMMDHLLARLRKGLIHQRNHYQRQQQQQKIVSRREATSSKKVTSYNNSNSITDTMKEIRSLVKTLNQHLMVHLEKEEKQCMPLVVKHLSKSEIHELVGKIMGKRSSDMIAQILTMAVQNLNEADKEEMVKHMKQAMVGTYFDRWLAASGWMDGIHGKKGSKRPNKRVSSPPSASNTKRVKPESDAPSVEANFIGQEITSQAELEKLIRAVATNPSLDPVQKNTTIQGLRTSVWKRNQRLMGKVTTPTESNPPASSRNRNTNPPGAYYQQNQEGEIVLVWEATSQCGANVPAQGESTAEESVPKFSTTELAPTYHDGINNGQVLGCVHYARACKLRHPLSGRLYTCRLCCEQEREKRAGESKDEPLDRYAVTEVLCMKCKTLQPAAKVCIKPKCELHDKGFAAYYCDICHLYDDRPRPIFHCPYCNVCRSGVGLGIDYRHCMRCNACVALSDKEHRCIPQKLQGSCPICHDMLFNSTEPLRGLRCGHVMHLSCFTEYRRGQNYTCPLCMRSMEDMSEYFSLLDQAVRIQVMPPIYQNTFCNLYCQDCDKTGQCRYHFVGQKCPHCGSYNTREMGRFESTTASTGFAN